MLFKQAILDGIERRELTLAYRRWKKAAIKPGSTLRTSIGALAIEAVDEVVEAEITERDAKRAGFASREALLKDLNRERDGQLFRVRLRLVGEDPRAALRVQSKLSASDVCDIKERLARLDRSSRHGAWTMKLLCLIADRPNARAGNLAISTGFEKEWLKLQVRKLKELGLTESLDTGYRISPRGRSLMRRLK